MDGASNTVFEMEGRFNRNLESRVKLAGVNSSFRNSSVFMQYAVDESHEQAFLEVDVLLDHLFCHVRRFVTSNPLPSYIRSVVVAFRCGTFDGKSNSGNYGNLGAQL